MRVVAGRFKGRLFEDPRGRRTHPMSEKARGALFNALGDISGLTVLDAFTGTGALAIEAVSRGAEHVLAIDIDPDAVKTVAASLKALDIEDNITVRRKNISGWSRNNQAQTFDLVLADPPYHDIRPDVLERLAVHVKPGGVYVLSWPGNEPTREFAGLTTLNRNSYGDASLVFYRKIQ